MNTTGDATDFADLTSDNRGKAGFGNDIYGFYCGGQGTDVIDRLTFATGGTATDFGNLTKATSDSAGYGNNVRGLIIGGDRPNPSDDMTVIEYITIQTTGNATDFGDLGTGSKDMGSNAAGGNTTRCVFTEVGTDAHSPINNITYITVATSGGGTDFGDTTVARDNVAAVNNSTRLVFGGGDTGDEVQSNVMDYVTIASTGNGTDFGDLTSARFDFGSASSSTKGLFAGGTTGGASSNRKNIIDFITIASTGNATDFGDLTLSMDRVSGASDSNLASQNEADFAPAAIGLIAGANPTGNAAGMRTTIQYINIASSGDAVMFGDLTQGSLNGSGVGSSTRAVFGIGATGGTDITSGETISNAMEFSTFSTKGKATDFGDLGRINGSFTGSSNSTIGLFAGGFHNASLPYVSYDFIDQITIASAGNATDHGDLTQARRGAGGVSNTTTAIFGGGYSSQAGALSNIIDSVAFASSGNATDFGDLTSARQYVAGASSSTRGVFAGGQQNVIDYITMSSAGNATDFGDLTASRTYAGSLSDKTSGVFSGGIENNTTIDVITIASTGNASDFGDMLYGAQYANTTASNSHGGL